MPVAQHDPAEWQRLSRQYRDYARFELTSHGSPIYAAICARLADDHPTGSLALNAEPGFRTPLILLAAVHHLLLSGLMHPLAAYYPSLAGVEARSIDDGLYPSFAGFIAARRAASPSISATMKNSSRASSCVRGATIGRDCCNRGDSTM